MKITFLIVVVAFLGISNGVFVGRPHHKQQKLLGAKECTWGPSYWCQNITTSASCHATKHCIDTVWIHKQLPPDTTSVCQTCLNMVKQARDQLLSNDTQELIKEVFEGSCALIHIKPVVKECDKVVDEFIPDLIDTLASQMNPQVVCSVAGLCNNERIHRMIEEAKLSGDDYNKAVTPRPNTMDKCEGCHSVVKIMETNFNGMSRDDVLQGFLHMCGKIGSLSDACSNIIITYFTEIYEHIQQNLNPTDVCLMSGECSAQFHTHDIEITPMSHVGYVYPTDDIPCELCEQLVSHLRDLLVANTTESEFKTVLEGLCKQTKSFKTECVSLVDQYYPLIYTYLVNELQPKELCDLINICPKNQSEKIAMVPLVPVETAESAKQAAQKPLIRVALEQQQIIVKPENTQLPIELLAPPHTQNIYSKQVCAFCEYFLHYVQEVITDPKSEAQIKHVIDGACERLPPSINSTCVQFVDMYEPAFIALLAQEVDPSTICPLLKACPGATDTDVEVFMDQTNENPQCPLCLYAVSKLENMVKDQHTEENIKKNLKILCDHLPKSLAPECEDFVETYTDELVEMLMADFSPDEVCVYIKLCPANKTKPESTADVMPIIDISASFGELGGDVRTNIIPDNTINGQTIDSTDNKPQCVICEFVMRELEQQLDNNKTDEEIKKIVYNVCKVMPKSVRIQCDSFVDTYADTIIRLLIETLEPKQICSMMNLCADKYVNILRGEVLTCAVCEGALKAMKEILENPNVDHNIVHVLEKTCRALPKKFKNKCHDIIDEEGQMMIDMLIREEVENDKICHSLNFCPNQVFKPSGFY